MMTTLLIEKIARAIYDTELAQQKCSPISDDSWSRLWAAGALRRLAEPKARAAIAVLAKPENITDEIIMAANIAYYGAGGEHNGVAMRKALAAALNAIVIAA
jgi:hypothetical protein